MNVIRAKRRSTVEVDTGMKAARRRCVDDDTNTDCVDVPRRWLRDYENVDRKDDEQVARISSLDDVEEI